MIYLLLILWAFKDGLNISWAHTGDVKIKNAWHCWGLVNRILLTFIACVMFFDWGLYMINPAFLLDHGIVLTIFMCAIFGRYLYDITINITRNKYEGTCFKWSYCGTKDQNFWRAEFYILIALTIAWAIFGKYIIK